MLHIKNWNDTFENAQSRKRDSNPWMMLPIDLSTHGYVMLMSMGERGIQAYGVFLAICQWSASRKKNLRGKLCRNDGSEITENQLASYLRMDVCHLSASLKTLKSADIAWIIDDNTESTKPICHSDANHLPPPSQNLPPEEEREGEREEEREREGDVGGPPLADARVPNLTEVESHFFTIGHPGEADNFFNHYQAQGWRLGNGLPVTDWKALAHRWISNPKQQAGQSSKGPKTFVSQAADAMGAEIAGFMAESEIKRIGVNDAQN